LPTAITVASANIVDGSVTAVKLNGLQPAGPPIFGIRAWVNFVGTPANTTGVRSIRAHGNVSSVTRTAVGRYSIVFTTPMPDADYAVVGFARDVDTTGGNYFVSAVSTASKTINGFQIAVNSPGGAVDSPEVNLMIIR